MNGYPVLTVSDCPCMYVYILLMRLCTFQYSSVCDYTLNCMCVCRLLLMCVLSG